MFRYILAILLINTCYHSLGNPVPQTISSSLVGIHCDNPFLNNLIKSKIKECSVAVPPLSEKQFQCLIFYDMCNQLCAAVSTSQLVLNEDYTAKINEEQDVNSLCDIAKNWEFKNMGEFTHYKTTLENAFKHSVTCGKVCGAEELTSSDANFFCKYFNWGLAALKTSITTTSQKTVNITLAAPVSGTSLADNKNEASDQGNESLDIAFKNTTSEKIKVTETSLASTPEKVSDAVNADKQETVITSTNKEVPSSIDAPKAEKNQETKIEEPPVLPENAVSGNDQVDKEVESSLPIGKAEKDASHNVLENPKNNAPNDGFDYQDTDVESEEGKDGLIDMQGGDDGDDPMTDDSKANKESKADDHKEPSLSSFNREISQGDYYHTVQDGYSDGDDDHFFTFFLTAVVMVVLLYVLYHNKNKVSKVFFGLLLEGRQPGRRRNSRGHAYRRLDTLEQAMSTNTAAPPSKIIY